MNKFTCSVRGCDEDAKVGGMCVPHKREEIAASRGKAEPQVKHPAENKQCACGADLSEYSANRKHCPACAERLKLERNKARSQAKKAGMMKEQDMSSKTATCKTCKRELNEGERVYKGKCPECRGKVKKTPKPRKTQAGGGNTEPRPKAMPTARKVADSIVGQLQAKMLHHISEAEKIRETLTTIKELTGASFEIPETGI